jgi:hypothetical protein
MELFLVPIAGKPVRPPLFDFREQSHAIDRIHINIEDGDPNVFLVDKVQGFVSVICGFDLIAFLGKYPIQKYYQVFFVVDRDSRI